jgi:hypothetical protein
MKSNYIGKKVIVRANGAGVFYGTLEMKDGNEIRLKDARRIYHWEGATDCCQLAVTGPTNKTGDNRITISVKSIEIENVLEVLPCTKDAIKTIEGYKPWKE